MAQDKDYWRALVNKILNPLVPQAIELVSTLMPSGSRYTYYYHREKEARTVGWLFEAFLEVVFRNKLKGTWREFTTVCLKL